MCFPLCHSAVTERTVVYANGTLSSIPTGSHTCLLVSWMEDNLLLSGRIVPVFHETRVESALSHGNAESSMNSELQLSG
jgi:hypothetical protein